MASKNSFIVFSLLFSSCLCEAKIILPELLTKQDVNNIRFLSQDGKFTYYQKSTGSLLFSTNYKVQEIIKGEGGTEYTLFASPFRKKILVLQNTNYHHSYSLRSKLNIFLMNYGETSARKIGEGVSPKLLFKDTWLSYYNFYTKILHFENTTSSELTFSIKLKNKINPYFIPQVLMSDENTIYYTDLNEDGVVNLVEFKRSTSDSNIVFKANSPMVKVEICQSENFLFLELAGIHFSKQESSISRTPLPLKRSELKNFSTSEQLYKSELNDLGHMVCDLDKENIIFIKNFGNAVLPEYDIAELNISSKKITPLTELKTISNIINLDGTLLTLEKGKYYIVRGSADYKNIDTLKAQDNTLSDEKKQ